MPRPSSRHFPYIVNELSDLTCQVSHVLEAARRLVTLDERQVNAVDARIELDLRIGYAFTRFLTTTLRPLGGALEDKVLSYGEI